MPRLRRRRRGHLACERGVALVEFALVLPFLLVIVFGMVDVGKAISYWNDETHLANEAARYAAVNACTPCGGQKLEDWIKTQAESNELKNGGGSIPGGMLVKIRFPDYNDATPNKGHCAGDSVKVITQADYKWLNFLVLKGLPLSSTITGSSTMRLEKDYKGDGSDAYTGLGPANQAVTTACS
jgi:hypothetical protein